MIAWTLLLIACGLPTCKLAPRCDLAEINHAYGSDGKLLFVQLLAWDWSPDYRRHDCQAWVIIDDWKYAGNRVESRTASGDRRDLQCKLFRETWTIGDPERENLKLFPAEYRRKVW